MHLRQRRNLFSAATAAVAVCVAATAAAAPASADPDPGKAAVSAVRAPAVKRHLQALQDIAAANGGTRASGTPGFTASRDYVAGQLRKAGYKVTLQPFEFPFFSENSTAVLDQISPDAVSYTPTGGGVVGQFATMTYSGSGEVTGTVQAVDLVLPPTPAPSSTSGCEAADFAGFTPGNIALLQRGTCTFQLKAQNAEAAGASAAIIFNEGQPGRVETLTGTLGAPGITIPVVGASFAVGEDLNSPAGTVVRVKTDTESENRTTWNVLAETRAGNAEKVVMGGSHLDSVVAGPGLNDNGSGSAALLELALYAAKVPLLRNKLRFAWWGAEELGLLGSTHYVANLTPEAGAKTALYLNYDMVASPNYAYKIYDGDDSDAVGAPAGPPGSDEIEKVYEKYFDTLGIGHVGTDFDGRSDYGPFIAVGIPAGGLFTGAEGVKTPAEATLFGGTAGEAYDHCYHQACDSIANINDTALKVNLGAMAYSALRYAFSKDLPGPDVRPAKAATVTTTATVTAKPDHGLVK
ncbi:MAG: M28 family peptidase [Streptosporangiaceae bacterium]